MNGDKQIVKVVVNNLLAPRKSRQRKRKKKPVLAIGSTSKPATAEQKASGQSSGKVDQLDHKPLLLIHYMQMQIREHNRHK